MPRLAGFRREFWPRLSGDRAVRWGGVTVRGRRRAELGPERAEDAVPQTHPADAEAEVDFGELRVVIKPGG